MPFFSTGRPGLSCVDCPYSLVYPYRNRGEIRLSKRPVCRGYIFPYPAFVASPRDYYCMGFAESVLLCIFSRLCVLHPIYYLQIEMAARCCCAVYMGCAGIYTVVSVVRISVVFHGTHPVSASPGNTGCRYHRRLRYFLYYYYDKCSYC